MPVQGTKLPFFKRLKLYSSLGLLLVVGSADHCPELEEEIEYCLDLLGFTFYIPSGFFFADSILFDELDFDFLGFLPPDENGFQAPAADFPLQTGVHVGFYRVDLNFDGQPDISHKILATSNEQAFIDANGNGELDSDEIVMDFDPSQKLFHIGNPAGGESIPPGVYRAIFFEPIFGPLNPDDFAITVPVFTFIDQEGAESIRGRINNLVLIHAQVLPHVPFGVAGDLTITSQIVVNNPHNMALDVNFQFFEAATGIPAEVKMEGNTSGQHTFNVPANSSRLFEIDPTGVSPPQITWGFVHSTLDVGASVNFVTFEGPTDSNGLSQGGSGPRPALLDGKIVAEAGIAASGAHQIHVLNVFRTNTGVDSAFAIVNPTDAAATIKVTLTRPEENSTAALGLPLAPRDFVRVAAEELVAQRTLTLARRTQTAVFIAELMQIPLESFLGTLLLVSDTDIAVTSLKTVDGRQSASLPSGTLASP